MQLCNFESGSDSTLFAESEFSLGTSQEKTKSSARPEAVRHENISRPPAPPSKIALPAKRDLHPSRRILVLVIFYRKRKRLDPMPAREGSQREKRSQGSEWLSVFQPR
ncbi:MAG: hypothetical protein DMG06_26555 [Acidobacteria bacterium]|nr:MAG: hypothetical protein DMG06_26555 [Acidobacteriota bacterium]